MVVSSEVVTVVSGTVVSDSGASVTDSSVVSETAVVSSVFSAVSLPLFCSAEHPAIQTVIIKAIRPASVFLFI